MTLPRVNRDRPDPDQAARLSRWLKEWELLQALASSRDEDLGAGGLKRLRTFGEQELKRRQEELEQLNQTTATQKEIAVNLARKAQAASQPEDQQRLVFR